MPKTHEMRSWKIVGARLGAVFLASALAGVGVFGDASAGTTTYQYDALGRVIKVVYPDLRHICYAYDSAGNRTQVKRQATGSCTVSGSTLTNSLTAETMLAAQQSSYAQAASLTTSETDSQVAAESATATTLETDDSATTN